MKNKGMASTLAAFVLGSVGALLAPHANAAEEKVLNLYNWSAYIADDTVAKFEKEYGIKVNYDTFDSSELLHAKLVAGKSGYDVVITSSGWGPMQSGAGLLRPLDLAKLPNLKNMDPALQAQIEKLDPGHKYLATWLWGYTTVGINEAKVKAALGSMPMPANSWDLIFKPEYASKLKSCGISMLDSASEVIPAALHYLGLPLNSNKPEDYTKVKELLKAVRPSVTLFSSASYSDEMIAGSVCVAMGWSGDLNNAAQKSIDQKSPNKIKITMPKSGGILFFDTMAIPADAPHPENAHLWMNYIMRPEVHASLTNAVYYANPNKAATKFVVPELAKNPMVYPSAANIAKMGVQGLVDGELRRLMARTFTNFKSGL